MVPPLDASRLAALIGIDRAREFQRAADTSRRALTGRTVVNVNSTATGGGVAELLQTLLAYARGVGVSTRWLVIRGDDRFFEITKRVHNHIYGSPGDGGSLDATAREHYEGILAPNTADLLDRLGAADILLLHDPQTAGMVPALRRAGHRVVWRCHIGRDRPNEHTEAGWDFLRPHIEEADAFVFTRAAFAPPWIDRDRLHVITPSIDPFSAKNERLDPDSVAAVLAAAGIVDSDRPREFRHEDGRVDRLALRADLLDTGPVPPDVPLVAQLSRWDPQKDMVGVLEAFAHHDRGDEAHLLLSGPSVAAVDDDPEAGAVLRECVETWRALPQRLRRRVHLACVPLDEPAAAATVANAIQRHASVVAQKSLAEGFGLTVVEAMWKERAVVATRVGGIVDQLAHEVHGLLVDDPQDGPTFADYVQRLLADASYTARLGRAAYVRAHEDFLGDRHLEKYGRLFASVL